MKDKPMKVIRKFFQERAAGENDNENMAYMFISMLQKETTNRRSCAYQQSLPGFVNKCQAHF